MKSPRLAGLSILIAPIIIACGATRFEEHSSAVLQRNPGRDTVGCFDILHASDSLTAIVTMSVTPQDRKAKLPLDFEGLFVQEFRSRLKVPENLPSGVVVGWSPCDSASHKCVGGALMLGSQAYATAHPGGTLSRIVTVDFALTPTLSDSVRAALQKLSDERSVPFFTEADSIPLDISIRIEQHSDTVPRYRHLFRTKIRQLTSAQAATSILSALFSIKYRRCDMCPEGWATVRWQLGKLKPSSSRRVETVIPSRLRRGLVQSLLPSPRFATFADRGQR